MNRISSRFTRYIRLKTFFRKALNQTAGQYDRPCSIGVRVLFFLVKSPYY